MLFLVILPFLYIGVAAAGSAALPPVDYKAISAQQAKPAVTCEVNCPSVDIGHE